MDKAKIGEKLRKLREEHGETPAQLAEILNVSRMAISQWETGNRVPSDEIKLKYAEHYNQTVGAIFFNE